MAHVGKPAFGSSTRKTFGSPFSGYRGDYTVYPDEPWKHSLRKYPYPTASTSPVRHSRSISPRRKVANVSAAATAKRQILEEIMAKIDTTQEDLHALAQRVAAWSREAAELSEGLKEESLLLDLSRQADRLAASEAQHRELQKQERVNRLSLENGELRRELRQLVHICKMLLDQRTLSDPWVGDARAAAARPVTERHSNQTPPPPPRRAWQEREVEEGGGGDGEALGESLRTDRRRSSRRRLYVNGVEPPHSPTAAAAPPLPASVYRAGAATAADLPYNAAKGPGVSAPRTPAGGGRRRQSYSGGDANDADAARIALGLAGLTDKNAAYFVAAERSQADADADADLRRAHRRDAATAAAARPSAHHHHHHHQDPEQRREHQHRAVAPVQQQGEVDLERGQVGSAALAAADNALGGGELTLKLKRRSGGDGGITIAAAAAVSNPSADSVVSVPSFGGFLPLQYQHQQRVAEATAAIPEAWRRQQQQQRQQQEAEELELQRQAEMERVERELAAVERELAVAEVEESAAAAAEAAHAAAKATAAHAVAQVAAAQAEAAAAAAVEAAFRRDGEKNSAVTGTPALGTPLKLAEGVPLPAPPTPIYQAVPYSSNIAAATAAAAAAAVRAMPSTVSSDTVPMAHTGVTDGKASSYARTAVVLSGSAGAAGPPLNTLLLSEVERLKAINRALASSLHTYSRVADRLDGAAGAAGAAAPAPTGAVRTLFKPPFPTDAAPSANAAIDLAALATGVNPQRTSSVAATYGKSSASASSVPSAATTYTASYPLGVSVRAMAAPSTPAPAVRHVRLEEPRASWAPSTALRERLHGGGDGGRDPLGLPGDKARQNDSVLDDQLYGIRQQLQALRDEMVVDRLAALAASAPRGGATTAAAPPLRPLPAQVSGVVTSQGAAATPLYRDAAGLTRLKEEISELQGRVRDDRRWHHHHSLESVVSERSALFRELQRRVERLMSSPVI